MDKSEIEKRKDEIFHTLSDFIGRVSKGSLAASVREIEALSEVVNSLIKLMEEHLFGSVRSALIINCPFK
ncbi:MAG: hypothetical protein AAGU27_24585 [Dehalobacterium sp.]